jgi:hypothetical protein
MNLSYQSASPLKESIRLFSSVVLSWSVLVIYPAPAESLPEKPADFSTGPAA